MTMTDNDLRDLLARDASTGGGAGVTLADVDRRVRRIRRRRGVAGAAVAAGLATVVMVATSPRTMTISPADAPDAATAAGPSPTQDVTYLTSDRVLLDEEITAGGRKVPFRVAVQADSVNIQVECRTPSYAFVWHEGVLVDQGPCGIQDDHVDHLRSWTDQDGRVPSGRDEFHVAVIPPGSVVDGHGAVDADDAARIVGETGEYRTDARVTIREAFAVVGAGSPSVCQGDIVIRRPDGREILSSACDQPGEEPPSPQG
ncbi:hypothetical protein OHB01_37585 [Microbispora hainanensis]|jgi:hypothetical protein|uniref:hypothetical protein n=1 Tax=Microbispora TaxID=2005 RepID=UPI00115A6EC0|nr:MULTISPECIES: hypothetical protein [Microbispora]NJP23332.1 hypothetical protein [Microbispora sp. CL1-1]TQS16401.1 hypothetical protein FLW53_03735 [Microbispora sp. SCL1-1]